MYYRLSADGILAAWEVGASRQPLDRALAVLWAAGAGGQDAAGLPLAERDRRLLSVRAETFGPILPTQATCPECSAELEIDLDVAALAQVLPTPEGDGAAYQVSSRDLAAVSDVEPGAMAVALRKRLLPELEGRAARRAEARIVTEAEAAELSARLNCAECGQEWMETIDVAAHLWAEIERGALSLLRDVAEIAAAFGWTEERILALTPHRRAAYLAMLRQT